ncbi:hypothetical protein ACWGJB_19995 [Streptomyces sp. NPDC054813]|uniref:hypothetical protein n=1 Tax=Streptomyces sp. NPDC007157 TaxID=3154681 RepID=UPI0033C20B17
MSEHVAPLQLIGVTALALATVAWVVVLMRVLRHTRREATAWHPGRFLPGHPHQLQAGPPRESVELTPAEQDAFAGLVRRLGGR